MVKKILAGVLAVFCVTGAAVVRRRGNLQSVQYIQEDAVLSSINDGDIICRLGGRVWSMYFKELSPNVKMFSHLGIIRIRNNAVSVINAEGLADERKGLVNEIPLNDFLRNAQKIGIYRLKTVKGEAVSDAALEYVGLPFDWQFDMEDDGKLYCTELLYVVLKKIDLDIVLNKVFIKEIGKNIIPPDVCSQSEYFTEIGYWEKYVN